jgi:biopolymer transport protein ExbD
LAQGLLTISNLIQSLMKIKRTRKAKTGRVEIIPMIDVMFFLLATFILASLSMQRLSGLAVDLTKGEAAQINVEDKITLSITHDNLVFVNKEQIAPESVKSRLQSMLESGDKSVIVLADKHAFQGVVMSAMIAARDAGAKNFSIMARKE